MSDSPETVNIPNWFTWRQEKRSPLGPETYGNTERGWVLLGTRARTHVGESVGPNWRRIIADGGNATSDLNAGGVFVDSLEQTLITMGWKTYWPDSDVVNTYQWSELSGYWLVPDFPNPVSIGFEEVVLKADNRALIKYREKIAATHSAFKGMVFGGELAQTLQLIRNPAQALRRGFGSYLNRLKRDGPRLPRSRRPSFVRDTWLEYSYGWSPLFSDVGDAIDNFYQSKWVRPLFKFVKGNSGLLRADFATGTRTAFDGWAQHTLQWDQTQIKEAGVRYYGVYRSTGDGVANLGRWGFSPSEFVPTLWEPIPYSFLVDYFTNIGDIISSWSYRHLVPDWTARGEVRRSISKTENAKILPNLEIAPFGYHFYSSGKLGESTLSSKLIARKRLVYPGLPSLECQVPGMGTKWVNIAALTKQLSSTRRALRS